MSNDADKSLLIEIKTKAELGPALKLEESLKAQILKLKVMGKETADLEAKLGRLTGAIDKFGRDQTETAKKSEFLGLKLGELRHLTRELGEQFPAVALLVKALMNPIVAAFTIAIGIFAKAKEALDEWNKSLAESAAKLAEGTWMESIIARREELEKGRTAAEKFTDSLKHLTNAEEIFQQTVQASLAALRDKSAAMAEIEDAKFGFDEERLKSQLQMGLIDQAQYFTALGELEKKHDAEKLARERKSHQDEIAALNAAVQQAATNQPGMVKTAAGARTAATKGAAALASDQAELKTLEAGLPDLNQTVAKALDLAGKMRGLPFGGMAQEAAEGAIRKRDQTQTRVNSLREQVGGGTGIVAEADTEATIAEEIAKKNAEFIQNTQHDIALKTAQYLTQDQGASKAAGIKANTTDAKTINELGGLDIGGGFKGADVENAAILERMKAIGQPINNQQQQFLSAFEQFAQDHGGFGRKQLDLMFKLAGSQTMLTDRVQSLESLIQQLQRRYDRAITDTWNR